MKTLVSLATQTMHRKMSRSFAQRGGLGTAWRCLARPCEALWSCFRELLPQTRRIRAEERKFDRRHNVDTCVQTDPGWMARISSPNWVHGVGYAPIPIGDATIILSGLPISYEQFVFVDLGAGKGRAVLIAAEFPFKRIVGVEYCPALTRMLQVNLVSYRNPSQRCYALQGLLYDAAHYALPLDPLVLFFHHPFNAPVFHRILGRIESSLEAHPRKIFVVYYDPKCESVFDQSPRFRLLQRGDSDGGPLSNQWVVYESLPTETPSESS
jgi:hypothetical protein